MTAPHLAPGHAVAGKYRVKQLLGFTGEVATYQATDPQGRDVAVKLYDPAIGQRADVMSRLERVHASISELPAGAVRVIDAGYDAGTGAPFAVTELVAWPTLAQLLARAPLPPPHVARILHNLAVVLDVAHQAKLTHGGLKPTNLFINPSGDGQVRVADFGASVVRSTSPTHEAYAQAAPWWAPEQLNPSAVLGPATDVFAVALLAFYALTGRSFWVSCQSSPPNLQAWQQEVMGARPTASARARELGAVLNPALDVAFERSLAVTQAERPQSVGELANQFGSLVGYTDEPGVATLALEGDSGSMSADSALTPGLPPIPLKPRKKSGPPIVPIVIGVGAAIVLGGLGMFYLFSRKGATTATATGDASAGPTKPAPAPPPVDEEDDAPEPAASADEDESGNGGAGGGGGEGGAAAGDDDDEKVEVTILCTPACASIIVDEKAVDKPDEPIELAPGEHSFKLIKPGYVVRLEKIEVEAGKPIEKTFPLQKVRYKAPKKRCSKFLKNCR